MDEEKQKRIIKAVAKEVKKGCKWITKGIGLHKGAVIHMKIQEIDFSENKDIYTTGAKYCLSGNNREVGEIEIKITRKKHRNGNPYICIESELFTLE